MENAKVTAFTVSELLRENTHTHTHRLGLKNEALRYPTFSRIIWPN